MQFRHKDIGLMLAVIAAATAAPLAQAADAAKGTVAQAGQAAGQYIDDATLTTKVKTALISDSVLSLFVISVDTNKGAVTLSGTVDKVETIERAIRLAMAVPGVKTVNPQFVLKATN